MIKESKDGLILNLRISPNSSKNEVIKTDDTLKIKITALPIDGKANKALIEYLSKLFKVPKSSFEILKGQTSKDKTILISITDLKKQEEIKIFFNNL